MQHKAVYLLFCKFTLHFTGVNHTKSSGVHKTVTTASGTGHIFRTAVSLQRGQYKSQRFCDKSLTDTVS